MNLVELAQRIRSLRRNQQLTLEEVASQTGLTRSWLSKVENFRVTPSLPALGKIAAALGVTVSELVENLDQKTSLVLIHSNERKIVERNKSDVNTTVYESLAHSRVNRTMDPFLLTVPGETAREEAMGHEGEEFLIVLSGRVDFQYDDLLHSLKKGDSLYFDAIHPHRLINPNKQQAKVLCVFCA
jgi:transcriptional regulator with XRE-family HTH domain